MAHIVFILAAFFASVIGCICGIGGGVIIKPVVDKLFLRLLIAIMCVCVYNFLQFRV